MEKLADQLLSLQGHIQTHSGPVGMVTSLIYQKNNREKENTLVSLIDEGSCVSWQSQENL